MARTKSNEAKVKELTEKIDSLTAKKEEIEKRISELMKKRSLLQKEVESENLKSLMAMGLSMDELMKLAKEKAEEKELKKLEEKGGNN